MPGTVSHTESTPAQATAGPWTAVHNHLKGICFIYAKGEPVAAVLMRTAPERDENAKRIAAVPELVAALEQFIVDHDASGHMCAGLNAAYLRAKDALKKAGVR